jgi:hypothetical protein|tara:strand:+ start:20 stop:220 length:201 start_codon:yes stop_codon:yes gene_type:complete
MVNINLKTGFVIIAIYEILYWLSHLLTGQRSPFYDDEDLIRAFLWAVVVPLAAIVIYSLIRWASKE